MITWMLCALAFSALIGAAALLCERALPSQWPKRHVWTGALLLSLVVPVAALLTEGRLPAGLIAAPAAVDLPIALTSWAAGPTPAATPLESASAAFTAGTAAAGVWVASAILLLLGYAALWVRFAGASSEWRPSSVCGRPVRVATRLGPAVFGLRRPVIVVPEWVLSAEPAVQRVIMLHEVEHTRAGDHLLLGLSPLALVAMPWNVPLWWQISRLRQAVEVDCDRRVLRSGVSPREYGALLIDIASRSHHLPAALAALAEPSTSLERRIVAMSTRTTSPWRPRAALLAAVAALLLVTAFESFAVMAPAPASRFTQSIGDEAAAAASKHLSASDVSTPDVAGARAMLRQPIAADTPLVVIDGRIVRDADIERMIGDASIVSVEMVRGSDAVRRFGERAAAGVLLITTSRSDDARRRTAEGARTAETGRTTTGALVPRAGSTDEARAAAADAAQRARETATAAMVREGRLPFTVDSVSRVVRDERGEFRVMPNVRVVTPGEKTAQQPLYIVDGIIMPQASIDIDALNIESIEVVKGPAAANLYGSRASAGVIRITTRKK
jgi:bla regulator protein blaR1